MNNIMPNGTEVLLFKNTTNDIHQDSKRFIKGMVIGSYEEKEELGEDNSLYHQVYVIIGEDGEEYRATAGYAHIGYFFVKTVEEHIEYLANELYNNNYKIEELKVMNKAIKETIKHLNTSKQNSKRR